MLKMLFHYWWKENIIQDVLPSSMGIKFLLFSTRN